MINFDHVTKESIKEYDQNLPQIPDHPYRILIIRGFGSGKTNSLFNLINQILTKFIYMLQIPMKQNINFELINEKEQA